MAELIPCIMPMGNSITDRDCERKDWLAIDLDSGIPSLALLHDVTYALTLQSETKSS